MSEEMINQEGMEQMVTGEWEAIQGQEMQVSESPEVVANAEMQTQQQDFGQLLAKYGENVVSGMVEERERVEQVISDPEQLKNLTKEQVVELYRLRDNLNNQLNEILPALNEKKQAEFAQALDGIDNVEVKKVLTETIANIEDPNEAAAVIQFAKEIMQAVWTSAPQAQQASESSDPSAIKGAMKWEKAEQFDDIDIAEWLMSEDPELRARAKKAADIGFQQILAGNVWR
jgi:hypothetical protein